MGGRHPLPSLISRLQQGDMDAFAREYVIPSDGDKKVQHFDIYTAEAVVYKWQKGEGEWELVAPEGASGSEVKSP